jgi:hypothetical protein
MEALLTRSANPEAGHMSHFLAVVERNFTRAAGRVGIGQPPLRTAEQQVAHPRAQEIEMLIGAKQWVVTGDAGEDHIDAVAERDLAFFDSSMTEMALPNCIIFANPGGTGSPG